MQTAVLHARVVICKLSSLVMSICLHPPKKNLTKFTNKRRILLDCRTLAEEKVVFHASLWGAFSSKRIFASRRWQTSAVSVPFIFIESAISAWWWGRVEMDHRGRIDETEENYRAFKTRFIKANGNLGTEYIFPAFTHDSTVTTGLFLWMSWFGEGDFQSTSVHCIYLTGIEPRTFLIWSLQHHVGHFLWCSV